jgi:hypothetical protein
MNRWLWLLALGLSPCHVVADDPKTPPPQKESGKPADSAKDEFAAIQKEWQTQQMAFGKKYQEAKTQEEKQKLFQTDYPKPEPLANRCLALAEKWPDAPEAVDALFWSLANDRSGKTGKKSTELLKKLWLEKASLDDINKKLARNYYLASTDLHQALLERAEKAEKDPKVIPILMWINRQGQFNPSGSATAKKAQELILSKFMDAKEIGQLCMSLGEAQDSKAIPMLKAILEKNPHDDVKASACFGLGKLLGKVEATQAEAEKYLERAINEFPQAGKQVKSMAKGELNELKYLSIGKVIPEVKAKDLDDKEFKLSDYRGKVVLLDFWGFW